MPDSRLDKIRQHLEELKARLARGDVDEAAYHRMKKEVLSDLSPQERRTLGQVAMGPSDLHTHVPSLAELELAPGTVLFDQWRIVRELGRGGFGVVFEAEEVHLGETQAVKVLDPAMSSRPELLARFRREVTVMRRLDPRHIVRVYDYREDPDEHLALISMEYVAGGTVRALRDLAREKEQPVPVAAVVAILAQTLEALAEAHDQGVIHRDVTPGNILLAGAGVEELLAEPTRDPGVKLVDFGIAGLVEHAELSQKSRALGTAAYVAPEALEADGEVTPAADVYGAGAVAYELLTGKLPLGRFPQPSETRTDVPPELDRLVPELLDLDPAKRPSARRARNRALARTIEPPPPPVGKGRWAWVGAAAVLAVAVLFVVFGDFSDWRPREPGGAEVAEADVVEDQKPAADRTPVEREAESVAAIKTETAEQPNVQKSAVSPRRDEVVEKPVEREAESVAAIETETEEQSNAQKSAVSPRRDEVVKKPSKATPSSWQDPKIGMRFRYIPSGSFTMGSPESEPGRSDDEMQHKVTLTRAFWMAETEVTQAEWRTVMGTEPSFFPKCGDECPVEGVSWYDAVTFANRLSKMNGYETCYVLTGCEGAPGSGCDEDGLAYTGDYRCTVVEFTGLDCCGYRLPTEAEWEYAARAGTDTALYTGALTIRDLCDGPELDEIGWYCGNSIRTLPVGRKKSNDWGLHDMLGNVWEWTWDRYAKYGTISTRDPLGPSRGSYRVFRGGCWWNDARRCRTAKRNRNAPGYCIVYIGFRLVRTYP